MNMSGNSNGNPDYGNNYRSLDSNDHGSNNENLNLNSDNKVILIFFV